MSKKYPYPLTIVCDRYCGAYSGGKFVAWPLDADQVPEGPDWGDCGCMDFWEQNVQLVGLGSTPEEAVDSLIERQKEPSDE